MLLWKLRLTRGKGFWFRCCGGLYPEDWLWGVLVPVYTYWKSMVGGLHAMNKIKASGYLRMC